MDLEPYFADLSVRDWQVLDEGTLRLAVVGVGQFAQRRALPAIEDSDFCDVTTLVTGSPERASSLAARYAIDTVLDYDGYRAGEASDDYDAVYVATPPAFHLEHTNAAAELGKHVLCEKPLEVTVDRARRLRDACADAEVVLMTGYRLQTEPAIRRMRELVADGGIGEPVQLHGSFSLRLLEGASPDTWRLDPDLAGGGALVDLGIYPLNTARFLLRTDPVAVEAMTTSTHGAFDAVEEHGAFQLAFPNGVSASCSASFGGHRASTLTVVGTDGQISVRDPFGGTVSHRIACYRGDVCSEYTGEPVDEVREEFDYFAHCVLADERPEPDGEDGIADLRAIEAAYEAAETACRVSIE